MSNTKSATPPDTDKNKPFEIMKYTVTERVDGKLESREFARLSLINDKLVFVGDADKAAKKFFNEELKDRVDEYIEKNK